MPYQNYRRNYKKNYGNLNKKEWASYMKASSAGPLTVPVSGSGYLGTDLVANSTETATPTPTIIKCKHFKVSIDTYVNSAGYVVAGPLVAYLMYVPQGYTLSTSTPIDHPEWVLSWRSIDTSETTPLENTYHDVVTMTSSLSRNLNSGDTIKLILVANNVSATNTFQLNVIAHFSCVVRNN